MNADGSNLKIISPKTFPNGSAFRGGGRSFSPSGGQIIFASRRDGDFDLYIVKADGTGVRYLINNPARDIQPDWQPVR